MKRIAQILSQYNAIIKPNVLSVIVRPILNKVLKKDVQSIFVKDIVVNEVEEKEIIKILDRFVNGEPLGKIINETNFYGYNFFVNEHVLDPRSDSEVLIDLVLDYLTLDANANILDLGVGSGCLLMTVLKKRKNCKGVGCDISDEALLVAKKNAEALGVLGRVSLIKSKWFSGIDSTQKFDVIISNPPYIESSEISLLDRSVKEFDPYIALDGGEDGLDCYRDIFSEIKYFMKPNTHIFIEIGYKQFYSVKNLALEYGLVFVKSIKDLNMIDRVIEFCGILL